MKEIIKKSILAGILIGIAGYANLMLGGIPGAIIFAFGLLSICTMGLFLYTGKAGSIYESKSFGSFEWTIKDILLVLLFNFIGTFICAIITYNCINDTIINSVNNIVLNRENATLIQILTRAITCGFIMEISVYSYRTKSTITGIIFGVPLFILCGFYHSIADSYYYAINDIIYSQINLYDVIILSITIIGNFIGCNIRRFFVR